MAVQQPLHELTDRVQKFCSLVKDKVSDLPLKIYLELTDFVAQI